MATEAQVNAPDVQIFIRNVLEKEGVLPEIARWVSLGLVHASVRGVDSHGIRLLPHYLKAVQAGRINPRPNYSFKLSTPSTGSLDADHTFGHAAGMEAVKKTLEMSENSGFAAVAVRNSSHFGAASFFALEIAKHDRIGLSFTNTNSLILPTGGKRPYLGNNPICFTAPIEGEDPLCLDMATSTVTFNKVLQWRGTGEKAPTGVGADRSGEETSDPKLISSLLPIGDYKGYGLSLMVEILCSLLTGMPFGPYITDMYKDPIEKKRKIGHFFIAIRIDAFEDVLLFKKRMKKLVRELRDEPPRDPHVPIQVAGDPEKKAAQKRTREGIPLSPTEAEFLTKLSDKYKLELELHSCHKDNCNG